MNGKREVICVICPKGCRISPGEGNPDSSGRLDPSGIQGYRCKRGKTYALSEFTAPVRMLTATVKVGGGEMPLAPVKSEKPLPKPLLLECMKAIKGISVQAPVMKGDVLIKDICGTGIDMIATGNVFKA